MMRRVKPDRRNGCNRPYYVKARTDAQAPERVVAYDVWHARPEGDQRVASYRVGARDKLAVMAYIASVDATDRNEGIE
jgi:hypothetical protein